MRPLNKNYLYRLLEQATDTTKDKENSRLGKYRITPQHGINVAMYIIYKNNEHLATVDITDEIRLQLNKPTKRERQIFEFFFETVYDKKPLKVLEL